MIKENASFIFPGVYAFLNVASVILAIAGVTSGLYVVIMLAFPWNAAVIFILGGAMLHDDRALWIGMFFCLVGAAINTYILYKVGHSAQYDTIRRDQD